jgi:hypothetical protein
MRLSAAMSAITLAGMVSAGPAQAIWERPRGGTGQIRIAVEKQDVLNLAVPILEPGKLRVLASYRVLEGETTSTGSYEISYASVEAGQTMLVKLAPGGRAKRILDRRGHLTVSVTIALRGTTGALESSRPRRFVLHAPRS